MNARKYEMSYTLKPGPPKARSELTKEEGLTDRFLGVSILHTAGGGSSAMLLPCDANGMAPLSEPDMLLVATTILNAISDGSTNAAYAARDGLSAIRAAVVNG